MRSMEYVFVSVTCRCVVGEINLMIRSYLFESGEGLNVYAEDVTTSLRYKSALLMWLNPDQMAHSSAASAEHNLCLPLELICQRARKMIELQDNEDVILSFTSVWATLGYLQWLRYFNLVDVLTLHPEICAMQITEAQMTELRFLRTKLNEKLINIHSTLAGTKKPK